MLRVKFRQETNPYKNNEILMYVRNCDKNIWNWIQGISGNLVECIL